MPPGRMARDDGPRRDAVPLDLRRGERRLLARSSGIPFPRPEPGRVRSLHRRQVPRKRCGRIHGAGDPADGQAAILTRSRSGTAPAAGWRPHASIVGGAASGDEPVKNVLRVDVDPGHGIADGERRQSPFRAETGSAHGGPRGASASARASTYTSPTSTSHSGWPLSRRRNRPPSVRSLTRAAGARSMDKALATQLSKHRKEDRQNRSTSSGA